MRKKYFIEENIKVDSTIYYVYYRLVFINFVIPLNYYLNDITRRRANAYDTYEKALAAVKSFQDPITEKTIIHEVDE